MPRIRSFVLVSAEPGSGGHTAKGIAAQMHAARQTRGECLGVSLFADADVLAGLKPVGRSGGSMTTDPQGAFPSWDERYQQQSVETMPWFYPQLDDDLKQALDDLKLYEGRALDLGTGPGTQALQLAQRGFEVTATDLSAAAVRLASARAETQGLRIAWQQDDILSSRLTGPFDLIFDRGCFHVLPPERRAEYVRTVAGLLRPGGSFFLKCFSQLQPGTQGPNRFTPAQIQSIFSSRLQVRSVSETVYQGTLDPLPRALFCVMQRTA